MCCAEVVAVGSHAASAICSWIHSIFKYAEIYKQVAPKIAKLIQAEEELTKVRGEGGEVGREREGERERERKGMEGGRKEREMTRKRWWIERIQGLGVNDFLV